MVYSPLAIGGIAGVVLSGAFVYWEVGRYAAPQVAASRFNESKALWGYAAGLFVALPLALVFRLFQVALEGGALLFSGLVDIAILVLSTELAQWMLARSRYFGRTEATPFYALTFRCGIAAILIGAESAAALAFPIDLPGALAVAAQAVAILAMQVAGALQSVPRSAESPRAAGGPVRGGVVAAGAYVVLAFGYDVGSWGIVAASLLIVAGLLPVYRRQRGRTLDTVVAGEAGGPVASPTERPFARRPG